MSTPTVDRLHVAVLDGHLLGDDALARLAPECRSLTAFTSGADHGDLATRWSAVSPDADFIDGGHVADLREALIECAKRRIVVIATGEPSDPRRFVAQALQGAAAMTEFDVPGVAVHVLRPQARSGTVAWLTETGELSGYGVLFAVGYAHLHGTGVELIEPTSGLDLPRTEEALTDALAFAEAAGVEITRHTDPSPFARVIRDPHCIVVHPVLDAPKGFNLLHPGELSNKAVASGNPAVVVELLETFPGDVVAVFDGVHLLSGAIPAARIAAGVALGVVAAAGIGTVVATPAMAAPVSSAQHATGNNVDVNVQVPGITIVATPHAHGGTTLTLNNTTDHDITVRVVGGHGHGGSDAGGQVVTVRAHEYASVTLGGGVKQWYVEPGPVQHSTVTTPQTTPEKAPDPIIVTGTVETFTELSPVVPITVVQPTTETELETTDPQTPPPKLEVPTPEVTVMQTPSFTVTGTNEQTPPDVPQLTPPDPTQQTPPMVPQGVPTPVDQKVPEPMLVPPLPDPQVTTTQVTTTQVTTEQGGPLTTTEQGPVTSTDTTQTPITDTGVPDASLPVGAMSKPVLQTPSTTAGGHVTQGTTHHASHPGHVTATAVDGDHAPSGELAHTGGNTAILAIVAGSLLAAGAGLAVASRVGKDEQPGT